MAVFCQIIVGLFCLQATYPADPHLTAKFDTNGLFSAVHVEGKGWTAEHLNSDMLEPFNRKAINSKHLCVQDVCVDFRRKCHEVDSKVGCDYDIDAGRLVTISVNADNPDAMQRASHTIALYRGGKETSDFPLALLDEAADKSGP